MNDPVGDLSSGAVYETVRDAAATQGTSYDEQDEQDECPTGQAYSQGKDGSHCKKEKRIILSILFAICSHGILREQTVSFPLP